jgi:hypothetical protein
MEAKMYWVRQVRSSSLLVQPLWHGFHPLPLLHHGLVLLLILSHLMVKVTEVF